MTILLEEKEVQEFIVNEFNENNYTDDKTRKEAKKRDNKCKSLIVQCLGDDQVDLVRDRNTAYSMWKSLQDRYEKKGIPGQLVLRKRLMGMKMKENENQECFLGDFEEVIRQLKVAGAECKEEDMVCILLLAMPKSFETVLTILENVPPTDLTIDLVKTKLRAEVERRKAQNQSINAGMRLDLSKPAAFSTRFGVCHFCGEMGHFKRECKRYLEQSRNLGCPNRGRGNNTSGYLNYRGQGTLRGRGGYGRGQARGQGSGFTQNRGMRGFRGANFGRSMGDQQNIGQNGQEVENLGPGESDNGGICFMANVQDIKTVSHDLLFCIDSGCTDHLVNNKNYFSELMMLNEPIKIAVAKDNNYMEAVGVGNIKVISKVQGKEIECTIKNVFLFLI